MTKAKCTNCGLPLTENPHPNAGMITHLNKIGAVSGCLPCAELRATGRQRLIVSLERWLNEQIEDAKRESDQATGKSMTSVLSKIAELEKDRRAEFHQFTSEESQ